MIVGTPEYHRDQELGASALSLHYLRNVEIAKTKELEKQAAVHRERAAMLERVLEAIHVARTEGLVP